MVSSPEPTRRQAVPYVLVLAFLAILGLSSESIRSVEAIAAAAAFPAVMLYFGYRPFRAASVTWVSRLALAVAAFTGLASEYLLYREFFPPEALAHTALSPSQPDSTVEVADANRHFELVVRGRLRGASGNAEARYDIELQRGDRTERVEGELVRHQGRAPQRSVSMTRSTGSTSIESGRHQVGLDGPGPLRLHLAYLGDGAHKDLEVTVYPRALGERAVAWLFGVLVLAGAVAQAAGLRKGIKTRLPATVTITGVYTMYLQRYLDVDDALLTVLPAIVVSFVLGGIGGLVVGRFAGLFGKKAAK